MAIAETSRMVASLELRDLFSAAIDRAARKLDGFDQKTAKTSKGMGVLGHTVSTALGVGLERAVSGGIGLLSSSLRAGVDGANKLELAQAQTQAALKSTGNVAGVTAESIRNLAEKYEGLNATIDDKVIQSAENLLLTFTNVKGKAFEPALQSILDMNQAMGGGEAGLQNTVIQVGKALQDPIRGATALRRVGVALTKQQQEQIKTLVSQNRLYDAQQVILGELTREFGGSFAAAGKTAAGQQARLRDTVEDLQITFAKGLLPGLNNVRAALIRTFADPKTQAGVADFGKKLGSFLTPANINAGIGLVKESFAKVVEFAKQVPWETIGQSLKLAGQGAKVLFGAFTSLPPWVQTAVLTGWGLNKLTGGFLGQLAGGLIKGILGLTAGVVNARAGVVNVVGPSGVPTGGGKVPGLPPWVGPLAFAAADAAILLSLKGSEIGPTEADRKTQNTLEAIQKQGNYSPAQQKIVDQLKVVSGKLAQAHGSEYDVLLKQQQALEAQLIALGTIATNTKSTPASVAAAQRLYNLPAGTSAKAREGGVRKPGITAAEFERILKTTPFIGTAQYKSIFEQFTTAIGGGRGKDPTGQTFLSLVQKLDNPKAPQVMFEIQGHLKELRNLEQFYIAHGDIQNALKVQGVIDKVDALIGVTEKNHPATVAAQKAAVAAVHQQTVRTAAHLTRLEGFTRETPSAINATASRTAAHLSRLEGFGASTATSSAITSRKNFSPKVAVTVPVSNYISVTSINAGITRTTASYIAGKGAQILASGG